MASCVLLLLSSLLCCCRWCRGCVQQLSPCFLLSFYEHCEKEKAASPHPERTNLCFFFRCSRDFFLCVINSSIVGGFDLEVVV